MMSLKSLEYGICFCVCLGSDSIFFGGVRVIFDNRVLCEFCSWWLSLVVIWLDIYIECREMW